MPNQMMGNNMPNQMMGNNMPNQMMGNNMQNPMQMMNNIFQAAMVMNAFNNMSQNANTFKENLNTVAKQINTDNLPLASPNDPLLVNFRTKDKNDSTTISITVQCLFGDKISKLIDNYRIKSQDYEQTKKFVFNAKTLDPSKTCLESGLTNNCVVYVFSNKHIKGA